MIYSNKVFYFNINNFQTDLFVLKMGLTGTVIRGQRGLRSIGNKSVLHDPEGFRTGGSQPDAV